MISPCSEFLINETDIFRLLEQNASPSPRQVEEILAKASQLQGLDANEVAALSFVDQPEQLDQLFQTARQVKDAIYGSRLVLFAPLYISNLCANDCLYCAFRARNKEVERRSLSQEEISHEARALIDQGHKRVLLVAGESYPQEGFSYVLQAVKTIYSVKSDRGEVRRINVNIAPLTVDQFRELKATGIGTYQLFQETYHRDTYSRVHLSGRKKDFQWRVTAMDRAMDAGIDDVGIGVLFGLYDWRFEVQALLQHIAHLESRYGIGPHTISIPRLEPAIGSPLASQPPHAVSDHDFRKLIAILRLAVPYTGLILSTRENPQIRKESFSLGISQISAGSRTNPGGYSRSHEQAAQFQLGDHRSLDEVVGDIATLGYLPSFCTACYRLGRTGRDFMDLAKPGEIKRHCYPNGLSTFAEYLRDYASPQTIQAGERLIEKILESMPPEHRAIASQLVEEVRQGKRDVLV
jgi:2-iminoacetate synthase